MAIVRVFLVILFVSLTIAIESSKSSKVLVLMQDDAIATSHSMFFNGLKEKGYSLELTTVSNESAQLRVFDEWQYDNLVLFAPAAEFPSGVSVQTILDFIDSGHNVIVAANSEIARDTLELASECNVEFGEEETLVIDHFNYDASDEKEHSLIVAENILDNKVIMGPNGASTPVLFRGVAQDVEEESTLVFPLITSYSTSYSANPSEPITKSPHVANKDYTSINTSSKK